MRYKETMTYKREQRDNAWIDRKHKITLKEALSKTYKVVERQNGSGYITSGYISLPVCMLGKRIKIRLVKEQTTK